MSTIFQSHHNFFYANNFSKQHANLFMWASTRKALLFLEPSTISHEQKKCSTQNTRIEAPQHHMVSNSLVVAHKKGLRVSFFLTYCWQLG